jgi:hypothetical protein
MGWQDDAVIGNSWQADEVVGGQNPKQAPKSDTGRDIAGGILRGAGSIGATLLSPVDWAARKLNNGQPINVGGYDIAGQDRRAGMDAALQTAEVDTNSLGFGAGKITTEVAGTLGVGGGLANALSRVPVLASKAAPALEAIRTAGMSTGLPAATTKAGAVGNLALRSAGGGITGAASALAVNPSDAGAGGAIGGALPVVGKVAGAAGQAVGAGVRAMLPKASPEAAALATRAKALGIDIPADRIVNSKPLNAAAASLNYVPFSGRAGTEAKMASQLDTAVSRTFGQNSDNVTQALRRASGDLGAKFDTVLQNNTVKMTPGFKTALADAETQVNSELGPEAAAIIRRQIADIQTKGAAGAIDGQTAYNIKKTLDRIGTRNTPEAYYARELKKSLMAALNDSLGPTEAAAFAKTRQQYGNMLALENLAQNGADGGISAARLANMKNINNPDLQELADIAAQFMRTRESPHGALQRLVIGGAATATATPLGAAAILPPMALAGRGANAALNSNALFSRVTGAQTAPNALNRLATDPRLLELGYRAAPVAATSGGR